MQDGIIKGNGASRFIKGVPDFLSQYPTYEDFVSALVAGTLTIDLNGINPAGWTKQGTELNKANLLTDSTAATFGLTSSATVNTVLAAIPNALGSNKYHKKIKIISSTQSFTIPANVGGPFITVILVGGGGGGGGAGGRGFPDYGNTMGGLGGNGGGGGSGLVVVEQIPSRLLAGKNCTITIGGGGAAGTNGSGGSNASITISSYRGKNGTNGSNGGNSIFKCSSPSITITAKGGGAGGYGGGGGAGSSWIENGFSGAAGSSIDTLSGGEAGLGSEKTSTVAGTGGGGGGGAGGAGGGGGICLYAATSSGNYHGGGGDGQISGGGAKGPALGGNSLLSGITGVPGQAAGAGALGEDVLALLGVNWIKAVYNADTNNAFPGGGGIGCPGFAGNSSNFAGGGGGVFTSIPIFSTDRGSPYLVKTKRSGGGDMFGFGAGGNGGISANRIPTAGGNGGCILIYGEPL